MSQGKLEYNTTDLIQLMARRKFQSNVISVICFFFLGSGGWRPLLYLTSLLRIGLVSCSVRAGKWGEVKSKCAEHGENRNAFPH